MFAQSLTSINSRSKEWRCLEKVIHQIGSKNEWLVLSPSFAAKFVLVFCLNTGKHFLVEVSFWSQLKEHRFFWKKVLGILKITQPLRDRHVFMWQSVEFLNVFHTSTLKQIFLYILALVIETWPGVDMNPPLLNSIQRL